MECSRTQHWGIQVSASRNGEPAARAGSGAPIVLLLLTLAYALNFLDRQIINILAESIKRDLRITDTQLGLLTGTAFGLFYAVLGIPIARLADRTNRVTVLSVSLFGWSLFTGICGLAAGFTQLLLARLGVGIGEAGGTPASQSLLSDHFPQDRRASALAVFSVGLPLGTALGFAAGGLLDGTVGWRNTLMIAAVPGVLLAVVIRALLREPQRGAADGRTDAPPRQQPLPAVRELLRRKSLLRTVSGGSCAVFLTYVCNAWLPAFFIRLHGLSVSQVGMAIAACISVAGMAGVLAGGFAADWLRRKVPGGEVVLPAVSSALTVAAMAGVLLLRDTQAALACMFVMYGVGSVWLGPTNAVVQTVAPVHSRSLATGVQLLVGNIVSLALGPLLVGMLSDGFAPAHGAESLRLALLSVAGVGLIGSLFYLSALRHLQADYDAS